MVILKNRTIVVDVRLQGKQFLKCKAISKEQIEENYLICGKNSGVHEYNQLTMVWQHRACLSIKMSKKKFA